MQSPILTPEKVPVLAPADFEAENIKDCVPAYLGQEEKVAVKMPLEINDTIYYGTAVSMGNPHFVTFIDDVANFPLAEIGPLFEMNRAFPDRVNCLSSLRFRMPTTSLCVFGKEEVAKLLPAEQAPAPQQLPQSLTANVMLMKKSK